MLARGSFGYPRSSPDRWDDSVTIKEEVSDSSESASAAGGAKPKRKRPKFIRKVECQICGDVANDHVHYGAIACYSCRAFFRRGVNSQSPYYCSQDKKCVVTKQTRKHCQFCRFKKCVDVGMKSTWVMTEEDKINKKQKAIERRLAMEAKRAEKLKKKIGPPNAASGLPRLVGIDEYEVKADFGPPRPLPPAPSPPSSPSSLSPLRDPPSPNYYVKEEPMSPGTLPIHSMSIGEFQQPMTHESGYSSGRSPGNILEDRPSSPEEDQQANPPHHEEIPDGAGVAGDLEMIENVDLGREVVPVRQPVLPYSIEEAALVTNLIEVELGTSRMIPVPKSVMESLITAALTGQAVPYKTTLDGYTICMKRIIQFAGQLDFFREFSDSDQKSLLLANTDMLVNIKSARMLRPGVNLQDQLAFANPFSGQNLVPYLVNSPLAFRQIYQTPWASTVEDEQKFQNMMRNIFDLQMDRTTTMLLAMTALFSVGNAELHKRKEAEAYQEFFACLLFRYLQSAIGKRNAALLLPRYMYLLSELEHMAEIMATKRLIL